MGTPKPDAAPAETTTDRHSDREIVVTRSFDAPVHLVFRAWTTPELLMRWWTPAAFGITFISCELDLRSGGSYRFVFGHPQFDQPMAFFGRYLEVDPPNRLVWTNEEGGAGSVTTVTFIEQDGRTLVTLRDVHPSKEALDAEIESGAIGGYPEQFRQLDGLLATLG